MKQWFRPNLESKGRWVRGIMGVLALAAAAIGRLAADWNAWVCVLLACYGLFAIFEAVRGWCVIRACGIKTRM